jgi:hypothetical protein
VEHAVQFADRMRDALGQRDAHCVALRRRVHQETARRRSLEAAEAERGGGLRATGGNATPISRVSGTPSALSAGSVVSPSLGFTSLPTSSFASTALSTFRPPPSAVFATAPTVCQPLASSPVLARPGVGQAPATGDVLGSGVKARFGFGTSS